MNAPSSSIAANLAQIAIRVDAGTATANDAQYLEELARRFMRVDNSAFVTDTNE